MATNTRLNLKLSLPRPEFFQHKKSQRLPPTTEENEFPFEVQSHDDSAEDATEWIQCTIREQGRWENHLSLIRVDCPHTMAELLRLGRLPKPEGTRQCRKMIRVPVLYDEIGCFLWEKLAALERGPDFGREDEERAAEYASGVACRTMMMLDERFCFDKPASTPAGSGTTTTITTITTRKGRARQDSEPVSPKHIRQAQAEPSDEPKAIATTHQSRPSASNACQFCQSRTISEHPVIPAEITADTLGATRGRVVNHHQQQPPPSPPPTPHGGQAQTEAQARPRRSSSRTRQRPSAFFNHSRSSSYTSTLVWRHEHPDTAAPSPSCPAGANDSDDGSSSRGSSRGSCSAHHRGSRDGSVGGRVGSVVGSLGRSVAVAIGGGLSHGYGFSGRADRSGSLWSV